MCMLIQLCRLFLLNVTVGTLCRLAKKSVTRGCPLRRVHTKAMSDMSGRQSADSALSIDLSAEPILGHSDIGSLFRRTVWRMQWACPQNHAGRPFTCKTVFSEDWFLRRYNIGLELQ